MVTRRFDTDELENLPEEKPRKQNISPPTTRTTPPERRKRPRKTKRRIGIHAHVPRTLKQVLEEANDMVVSGDLTDYVPLPTGFAPLDNLIGGGLRNTELVLLGEAHLTHKETGRNQNDKEYD